MPPLLIPGTKARDFSFCLECFHLRTSVVHVVDFRFNFTCHPAVSFCFFLDFRNRVGCVANLGSSSCHVMGSFHNAILFHIAFDLNFIAAMVRVWV